MTWADGLPGEFRARGNWRQDHQWTDDLPARLARHRQGHGARLVAVITEAGIGFTLARTVTGDRSRERAIKNAGGATRYCPVCCPQPRNGKWATASASPELPEPGGGPLGAGL